MTERRTEERESASDRARERVLNHLERLAHVDGEDRRVLERIRSEVKNGS